MNNFEASEDIHTMIVDNIADQLGLIPAEDMVQVLQSALLHAWEERHGWNTAAHMRLHAEGLKGPYTMKTFTVTIAGRERFDGEKPFTWVVAAPDVTTAMDQAMAYHTLSQEERMTDLEIDPLGTFEGLPPVDCAYHWNDLRDI